MSVSAYTSYDSVRLALGVDDDELTDEQIEVETIVFDLEEQLTTMSATLITDYQTIVDKAEADRSADEAKLFRRTRLFAASAVALKASIGLPLFAPKDITDGKAAISRFTGTPYQDVAANLLADYALNYQRLMAVVDPSVDLSTLVPTFFIGVPPQRDPVVSEI